MPLLHFYHSKDVLDQDDKQNIATAFTQLYGAMLPKFYVNVLFHDISPNNFYIGGEPLNDFVRLSIDHIARSFDSDENRQLFLDACHRILAPYIEKKKLRWELHVDETPFELWTIQGLRPPLPNSVAEQKWRQENRATPY